MFRMFEREVVKADQVRTIYKSQTFPTTGYGHAHNLDPELAAKIKQAFFTFEWKGSALEEEFVAEDKFVAIYHKSARSEEHTSELQSLMRNSYAVFCLKKK